ncbi:MAG: Spy/CpxP family protein refolding chaperone [Elusimicrobiota bacterium]
MLKYFFGLVLVSGFYSFLFSQQISGGPPEFIKGLNLTQEQMEKMKAIGQANESEMAVLSSRMNILQKELEARMKDPNATESSLNSKVNEIAATLQKLIKKGIEMKFKMKTILTQEQWKKMHESGMFPPMMGGGPMGGPMSGSQQQMPPREQMPQGQPGQPMPPMPPPEQK